MQTFWIQDIHGWVKNDPWLDVIMTLTHIIIPIDWAVAEKMRKTDGAQNKDIHKQVHHPLVGGIPTPLKNMKVSWDDYSNMESHKIHGSKPPTSPDMHPTRGAKSPLNSQLIKRYVLT